MKLQLQGTATGLAGRRSGPAAARSDGGELSVLVILIIAIGAIGLSAGPRAMAVQYEAPFPWSDHAATGYGMYVCKHEAYPDDGLMLVEAYQDGWYAFSISAIGVNNISFDEDTAKNVSITGYAYGYMDCDDLGDAAGAYALVIYDKTDDERVYEEFGKEWQQLEAGSLEVDEATSYSAVFTFKKDHVYRVYMACQADAACDPDFPGASDADFYDGDYYYWINHLTLSEPSSGDFHYDLGDHWHGAGLIPPTLKIDLNATSTLAVDLSSVYGFTGTVAVSVLDPLSDMMATLDQTYVSLSPDQTENLSLLLATDGDTRVGIRQLTLVAEDSGGLIRRTPVYVDVIPEPSTLGLLLLAAVTVISPRRSGTPRRPARAGRRLFAG